MKSGTARKFLICTIAAAMLVACKSEQKAAEPTGAGTTGGAAMNAPRPDARSDTAPELTVITVIGVDIDTRLAVMCGLEESKVFFKFDSAKVLPAAKERLQKIADCATNGPAKGKELVVVGRADPVGGDEYNKQLGMDRADSVAQHLKEMGVPKTRVEKLSKGEATATADPFGWPYERRVTVRLQE